MSTDFLSFLKQLSPFNISIQRRVEKIDYSFTLERKNFPDCTNKEFRYDKKIWNPFGKTGFGHHGINGWDFGLPEELK
jgi:hypothetical protein